MKSFFYFALSTIAFVCHPSSTLHAQSFEPGHLFVDSFEDGSFRDNLPVYWGRGAWSSASESINNNSLEINGTRSTGNFNDGTSILAPRNASNTSYLSYTDAIFEMRARITEVGGGGTRIGFLSRSTAPSGYFGRIDDRGEVVLYELPVGGPSNVLGRVQTDIDAVNNDVIMRLVTLEDSLTFSAWEFGDPVPTEPLISARDSTFGHGTFGLYIQSPGNGNSGSAAFRWVSVSEIPEPSAIWLALIGLAGLLSVWRMRRR